LKTESLNLNLLQEQCAELEKEKKIMNIELDAVQKESNNRINLLDSENNTVSFSWNRISISFWIDISSYSLNMKTLNVILNK
jgi:hypothetical protein